MELCVTLHPHCISYIYSILINEESKLKGLAVEAAVAESGKCTGLVVKVIDIKMMKAQ